MTQRTDIPAVKLPFSPGGIEGTDDDLFATFDITIRNLLAGLAQEPDQGAAP